MKRVLLVAGLLIPLLTVLGRTSELAVIVLNTLSWGGGGLPPGWQIKVTHGRPEVSACSDVPASCVRLKSVRSSFALERGMDVDPHQTRYLTWKWKVTQLPAGGDFRRTATDDQAAQVLVAFADRRVLTYIWDTSAPKGTEQSASAIPLVHIYAVVCESGAADANRWVTEARDVSADYERAYGRTAPMIKGLRLQINSQHTGTTAESYFGDVSFRSTLAP